MGRYCESENRLLSVMQRYHPTMTSWTIPEISRFSVPVTKPHTILHNLNDDRALNWTFKLTYKLCTKSRMYGRGLLPNYLEFSWEFLNYYCLYFTFSYLGSKSKNTENTKTRIIFTYTSYVYILLQRLIFFNDCCRIYTWSYSSSH